MLIEDRPFSRLLRCVRDNDATSTPDEVKGFVRPGLRRRPNLSRMSFVELLYADAPREAYEQIVRDAVTTGVAEAELEALRAERDVALRVRSQRERLRRREAELSALYETAQDLTAIRDVDPILQAIVWRARQLLGPTSRTCR